MLINFFRKSSIESQDVNKIMRKAEDYFLIMVIAFSLIYTVYFYFIDFHDIIPFFLVFCAYNVMWLLMTNCNTNNSAMIKFYVIELGVVLYPCALYIFRMGVYIFAMWYLLFPLVILIHSLSMNALRWLFYAILTIGSFFVTQHIFIFHNIENVKQEWKDDISIMTLIFMGIVLACFIFICAKKIMLLKDLQIGKKNVEKKADLEKVADADKAKSEQYKKIWEQIIAHFEVNEPFINQNYTISILATEINTNASYISRAIASNSGYNFSSLVNRFRIEKAKKMLAQGDLKRFSMEHIYTSSGFKYQSTFNEAFKKQEGITPTEFAAK